MAEDPVDRERVEENLDLLYAHVQSGGWIPKVHMKVNLSQHLATVTFEVP